MKRIETKRIEAHIDSLDLNNDLDDILHKNATLEEIENIKSKIQWIYENN